MISLIFEMVQLFWVKRGDSTILTECSQLDAPAVDKSLMPFPDKLNSCCNNMFKLNQKNDSSKLLQTIQMVICRDLLSDLMFPIEHRDTINFIVMYFFKFI